SGPRFPLPVPYLSRSLPCFYLLSHYVVAPARREPVFRIQELATAAASPSVLPRRPAIVSGSSLAHWLRPEHDSSRSRFELSFDQSVFSRVFVPSQRLLFGHFLVRIFPAESRFQIWSARVRTAR